MESEGEEAHEKIFLFFCCPFGRRFVCVCAFFPFYRKKLENVISLTTCSLLYLALCLRVSQYTHDKFSISLQFVGFLIINCVCVFVEWNSAN